MKNLIQELQERILLYDGAKGVMLQDKGLQAGEACEAWNINRKEDVKEIHRAYVDAGSDVIQTNTFPGNRISLDKFGLGDKTYDINYQGVKLAREEAGKGCYVAASVGPTGRMMAPMGELTFEGAYEAFREQLQAIQDAGADCVHFETFTDLAEMRAAILAARENTRLPIIASMTYEGGERTLTGTPPEAAALVCRSLGADVVGVNCSMGPEGLVSIIEKIHGVAKIPLMVKANAGLPEVVEGKSVFKETPEHFASFTPAFIQRGVRLIGGCCGTHPGFIGRLKEAVKGVTIPPLEEKPAQAIASPYRILSLDGNESHPVGILSLDQGDPQALVEAAREQVLQGAEAICLDYHKIHRNLDLVQFNHYNSMDNLWQVVFWMDFIRPIKEAPFWNTETSTCWNGATTANGYKEPGFCRANSWLPIALGGEANLYWLWRAHWSGQELMHGSVVSSCGRPLHIIDEVREIAEGFQRAGSFLRETRPVNTGLALHFSGYAWWLFEFQPMVNGFNYGEKLLNAFYHPLIQSQLRPDVIDPAASLEPYKVLCSPLLPALDESGLRERLEAWIKDGGIWVVGPLSDNRTLDATKYTHAPFGSLEEWTSAICKYQIPGDPRDFHIQWKDGGKGQGSIWYDGFELHGGEALATYEEGPLKGLAAAARFRMGKGWIYVLGTLPQPSDLQRLLLDISEEAGIAPVGKASDNLLLVPREGDEGTGMVVVELENRPAFLELSKEMEDLLSGRRYKGRVEIAPYTVMVLKGLE